jgi:hypothetical protein
LGRSTGVQTARQMNAVDYDAAPGTSVAGCFFGFVRLSVGIHSTIRRHGQRPAAGIAYESGPCLR